MKKISKIFFDVDPYQLDKKSKEKILIARLKELENHHRKKSKIYKRLSLINKLDLRDIKKISDVPFLPVQLFKSHEIKSIGNNKIVKTLTSSGTTGQAVSKIYLDKDTALLQTKALVKIVGDYIGSKRIPMIIMDSKSIFEDPSLFTARGAGILGMANFGRDHFYALNKNMQIDIKGLSNWLKKYEKEPKFIFGFTFMIWQYLYKECESKNIKFNLSKTLLLHSGGWKKMNDQAVSKKQFKFYLKKQFKLSQIHNFYGMVESVGSIYIECNEGFFHSPVFSEIIVRRHSDWSQAKNGEEGVIQVISSLAQSYPGHSILTEDLGTIHGVDNCKCGRKGSYFTISGRVPNVEMRGCSDTHVSEE